MPGYRTQYDERSDAPQFDQGSGAVGVALGVAGAVVIGALAKLVLLAIHALFS